MRWTWEVVLQISTFLGGLAAVVFFYDRYKSRERVKKSLPASKAKSSPSRNDLFFQKILASAKKQRMIEERWKLRWTAAHFFLSGVCFLLLGYWFGFLGQFAFCFLGPLPSLLVGYLLRKTKAKHEDAESVFSSGALFSFGGSFIAILLTCLLGLLNGDPNGDHIAGSGVAIVSGIFCVLEAAVCTYLMVRWV